MTLIFWPMTLKSSSTWDIYHYQRVPNLRTIHTVHFELSYSHHLQQKAIWTETHINLPVFKISEFQQRQKLWQQPTLEHFIPNFMEFKNETRQIWGIWKLRPAYSPETPNLGQNRWCFVPCDLEIWWMTLKNNRASLLCLFQALCNIS